MDFKQTEQTRRLVEVTALLALSLHGEQSIKVKKALQAYAFPEEIFESPAEIKAYHYCGDDDCKGDCE